MYQIIEGLIKHDDDDDEESMVSVKYSVQQGDLGVSLTWFFEEYATSRTNIVQVRCSVFQTVCV